MAYVKRFKELFQQEREKVDGVAYHGSKGPVSRFTDNLISAGGDLPGVKLYSDENVARDKGGPYVAKADVNLKKVVQTGENYKMKREEALFMINESPESKKTGRNTEFDGIDEVMKARSAFEGFKEIYAKYYRDRPKEFAGNMSKLGYDAVVEKVRGGKRYTVFNVSAITVAQGS